MPQDTTWKTPSPHISDRFFIQHQINTNGTAHTLGWIVVPLLVSAFKNKIYCVLSLGHRVLEGKKNAT